VEITAASGLWVSHSPGSVLRFADVVDCVTSVTRRLLDTTTRLVM